MKVQLLGICVALIAVSICGAGYAQSNPNPAAIQPGARLGAPAMPKATAPSIGQPSLSGTVPSSTAPVAPNAATTTPVPGTTGAGPGVTGMPSTTRPGTTAAPMGRPSTAMPGTTGAVPMGSPTTIAPGTGMTVAEVMGAATSMTTDANNVYVISGGMLYKFSKADITNCGIQFPPAQPCPSGAGPACNLCGTISYIPGPTAQCINVTTCCPCPPEGGAGKVEIRCNPNCAQVCPTTCPSPATCPTGCVPECPCQLSCDPCGKPAPAVTEACTTVTVAAGLGAGTCAACPPIGTPSACAQQLIDCLRSLSGPEVDKAYLQGLITINLQILTVSDSAATHLGTTRLQNAATNSVADSGSRSNMAKRWLRSKFCLDITACPPSSVAGFDICEILCGQTSSAAFDQMYRNQLVQFYIDEIAISQVMLERGCDSQVRDAAARIIKEDQERIARLLRCRIC